LKFNGKQIISFLNAPDPAFRVVLCYGADQGLVHERTQGLLKAQVEDPNDPFRVSHLTGAEIKRNPSRLYDEVATQSLIGGDRVVLIALGGEDIAKHVGECLGNKNSSLIIIEAGSLGPKSPLRRLVEKSKISVAMPSYLDDAHSLNDLIESMMGETEKVLDPEAKNYLINNIGSDRLVSRSELDKLITYMGQDKKIKVDDVLAIVGDNGAFSLDKITYPLAGGNHLQTEINLERAFKEGQTPITILRATIRHFHKLHLALSYMQKGQTPREALRAIKPPIMYLFVDQFVQQLEKWSGPKIDRALALLTDAEVKCKTTGLPVKAICGRALMSLSQSVRK
jgi:DNA polymerase-3 subunit delta